MATCRKLLQRLLTTLAAASILLLASAALRADDVTLNVHANQIANPISPLIYGHFFEHIYNGGDNGLWGEMVWNRSFEYLYDNAGKWSINEGVLAQSAIIDGARLIFGDPNWSDYEFTVEARKVSGNEGFLLIVRAVDDQQLFWANLAGWTNTGHRLQHLGAPRAVDLGQMVRGRVNTGQWYKLAVRCAGNHITASIDGNQVIDATIPADLAHGGAVGLGAWQTSVEYRNAKVTSLDGKVLFQGLPELPKPKSTAGIHWNNVGPADIHLTTDNPLNDETSVHIKVPSGPQTGDAWSGISQDHFYLKKGENYQGSLFLRGTAPQGGMVRFLSAGQIVNEIPIPAPTAQWKEYPLVFAAAQDAPDATMQILFRPGTDITLDQVSLMAEASLKNDGFRPDIYQAFAALQPTVIRWPGGCYAEKYHWKNAIGPQSQRTKNLTAMWDDYDPNALGTDEYLTLCRKVGAQPLLVINTGMHVTGTRNLDEWQPWIKEACDWVEYVNGPATSTWGKVRAANGHPEPYRVKFFEIDNELWRSLQTSPAVYAQAVGYFADAMKKVDPTITIIGHGGNAADRRYDRVLLDQAAPNFNILSIHHYMDRDRFDSGVAEQEGLYKDLVGMIAASKNPDIKLYVSEWNLQTTDWRTGLYAAGLLNTFEKYGANITMAGPALLFRHTSARDWDNAFINFDHKGWFPAPNYIIMKLWREHFADQRLTVDAGDAGPGRLNVIATKNANSDQVTLKLVNPTNAPINVHAAVDGSTSTLLSGGATFQLVAPGSLDARNTMAHPDTVKPAPAPVEIAANELRFALPAYSAGVVTIGKAK